MADWQPIATAPQDGTWILAQSSGWILPELVQWCERSYSADGQPLEAGYWQSMEDGPFYPTHWMPLPDPPQK